MNFPRRGQSIGLTAFTATLFFARAANAQKSEGIEPEVAPVTAVGDTATPVSADAAKLFDEARRLSAQGDFQAACKKFEESAVLSGGIGTKFNLADCFERLGKTHSAHQLFLEVARSTRALGQVKREQAALARATALEGKLSRLTIQSATAQDGVRLTLDGRALEAATLGTPISVDPGKHEVSATRPNSKPWSVSIEVPSGPTNVVIVVPSLEKEEAQGAPPPAARVKKATPKAARRPAERREGTKDRRAASTQRTVALVLGGVGVAGVLGGGFMGVRYLQHQEDAKNTCPSSKSCTTTEIETHETLVEDAKTARLWSFVGIGAGSAALAGAAILYFTDDSDPRKATVNATPVVGENQLGAHVSVRF